MYIKTDKIILNNFNGVIVISFKEITELTLRRVSGYHRYKGIERTKNKVRGQCIPYGTGSDFIFRLWSLVISLLSNLKKSSKFRSII